MADEAVTATKNGDSAKKDDAKLNPGRGPAYPSISLRDAVRRVMQIKEANATRAALTPEMIFRIWGFKGGSGASRPVLSSVGYYGLLETVGPRTDRRLRLSETALRIVLDRVPDSPERMAALKKAALSPSIHSHLMEVYSLPLPADFILENHLVLDRRFSESAAQTVVRVYKDTLEYAGLNNPDTLSDDVEPEVFDQSVEFDQAEVTDAAKVGDFVQWTSGGVDQFRSPQKVVGVSDDGQWLWVQGSRTGIPMAQVQVTSPPAGASAAPPPPPPGLFDEPSPDASLAKSAPWKTTVVGDRVFFSGSADLKQLKRLIKQLEGYKVVLAVEDDETEAKDGSPAGSENEATNAPIGP